jgi:hypothetical protein
MVLLARWGKNYTPVNHGLWSLVAMLCREYYLPVFFRLGVIGNLFDCALMFSRNDYFAGTIFC